jgi:hypothetical protein
MAEPTKTEPTKTEGKASELQKDREERKKKSDADLANLKKEFDPKAQEPRNFKAEDEFKVIAEKLSKARDRYLKVQAAAADSEDPNIEEIRELRTKAYGEYQIMRTELVRRTDVDL